MKSDGIDAWLRHWLKLQKKHRRPLVVKNPADKSSEPRPKPAILSKRKAKRAKARYIESDSTDDTADRDITDKSDDESQAVKKVTGAVNAKVLPPPPLSASATRKSRRAFLATLSSDKNYKLLQRLLYVAKVSKHIYIGTCIG